MRAQSYLSFLPRALLSLLRRRRFKSGAGAATERAHLAASCCCRLGRRSRSHCYCSLALSALDLTSKSEKIIIISMRREIDTAGHYLICARIVCGPASARWPPCAPSERAAGRPTSAAERRRHSDGAELATETETEREIPRELSHTRSLMERRPRLNYHSHLSARICLLGRLH